MIKKKIPWMIAFFLLCLISIWAIVTQSKSFSFPEMKQAFIQADGIWLLGAFVMMLGWIFFEGIAMQYMIRKMTPHRKNRHGILYSSANIYFSAITPSATGGQPASAFFMIRDGISVAHTTVILLINLVMYNLALIVVGTIGILLRAKLFLNFSLLSKLLIGIGYLVLGGLGLFFLMLLKKENILRTMTRGILNFLEKMRLLRHKEKYMEKLEHALVQYKECTDAIGGRWYILVTVFILYVIQRFCLVSVCVCTYMAFGGSVLHMVDVWVIQIMASIGSNSTPIPGSMGIADYLLIDGFKMVEDINSVANLELVTRGISFYGCVLVSIVIILIGYFSKRENKKEK